MKIFKSINKLNKEVIFKANLGFVPTMGSLHKGHISLIKASKSKCKKTLVSIFINPSQFEKKKDFNSYPRNLKKDIAILKKLKVDYVLIPNKNEIYETKKSTKIKINKRDKILCAKYRKGHFEGVLAVIKQFLTKINVKFLFLGEKDYQQIYLIKKFIRKNFNTKVISCKTVRVKNLIPFSSRNILLSNKNLKKAASVSLLVKNFYLSIKKNFRNIKNLEKVKNIIEGKNIKIDYFEIRNAVNLSKKINKSNFKIFIAYYINTIRLIDNF